MTYNVYVETTEDGPPEPLFEGLTAPPQFLPCGRLMVIEAQPDGRVVTSFLPAEMIAGRTIGVVAFPRKETPTCQNPADSSSPSASRPRNHESRPPTPASLSVAPDGP